MGATVSTPAVGARRFRATAGFVLLAAPAAAALALVAWSWSGSWARIPDDAAARGALVEALVRRVETALDRERGAVRMQALFPEGAFFTTVLAGHARAAQAAALPAGDPRRDDLLARAREHLDALDVGECAAPFRDTQVRRGVFWLGQRSLLAARILEATPEGARPQELLEEFRADGDALAAAFAAAPHAHLDSYPGACWPMDNLTAVVALVAHDRMFGSGHGAHMARWKEWVAAHADPTGLPPARIDARTGRHLEPARGSATAWMTAVAAEVDRDLALRWDDAVRRNLRETRLGFAVRREWPRDFDGAMDVDSGPIAWGAGVTATAVGIGASRAAGDGAAAADGWALANMFGFPLDSAGGTERGILLGGLPVGDAFLAWALSRPAPTGSADARGAGELLRARAAYHAACAALTALLLGWIAWAWRRWRRRRADIERMVVREMRVARGTGGL